MQSVFFPMCVRRGCHCLRIDSQKQNYQVKELLFSCLVMSDSL